MTEIWERLSRERLSLWKVDFIGGIFLAGGYFTAFFGGLGFLLRHFFGGRLLHYHLGGLGALALDVEAGSHVVL